jgi:hypothetical protein
LYAPRKEITTQVKSFKSYNLIDLTYHPLIN